MSIRLCWRRLLPLSSSSSSWLRPSRCLLASFRLPDAFTLPKSCYTVQFVRGSGPGGQGVNSSSNKAELRVDLSALLMECPEVDAELLDNLRHQHGNAINSEDVLIVTSHVHRSGSHNEAECIKQALGMLRAASKIPEAPPPPMEFDSRVLQRSMQQRRASGQKRKLAQSYKKDKLSGSSW